MKFNSDKIIKYIIVSFFIIFIYIIPILTLVTPDKKVSSIENKILSQKPKFSIDRIISKRFMDDFSSYVTDQFPGRANYIKLKNNYSYLIGNREFRNIYISKHNRLMEHFKYNKDIIDDNIHSIFNNSATILDELGVESSLILAPTSVEIYKNELSNWSINDSQSETLNYINNCIDNLNKTDKKLSFYTPLNILNTYKDYPIYFNTDHHWTQLGARIAYEDYKGNNININDLTSSNYKLVSNSFLGSYYSKALLSKVKEDAIYSYDEFKNYSMESDFTNTYNTLYGDNLLKGKNKYQYFLNGDPGHAIINGEGNKEILVVKDSYAHAFIPFLVKDYKKVHVIDTRYYKVDIRDYISSNPNVSKVLYLYNIQTFNSEKL